MADPDTTLEGTKISELPIVTTAAGNYLIVIVKGGITSRIRKADLLR